MTKNYIIILVIFFVVMTYLVIGAAFYVNDVRYSRTVVRLCPLSDVTSEGRQDCPSQHISLKEDWTTAITLTIGWLPILVIRAIGG